MCPETGRRKIAGRTRIVWRRHVVDRAAIARCSCFCDTIARCNCFVMPLAVVKAGKSVFVLSPFSIFYHQPPCFVKSHHVRTKSQHRFIKLREVMGAKDHWLLLPSPERCASSSSNRTRGNNNVRSIYFLLSVREPYIMKQLCLIQQEIHQPISSFVLFHPMDCDPLYAGRGRSSSNNAIAVFTNEFNT